MTENITFSAGMKVTCPTRYGDEVMIVESVRGITSPLGQRLALHHQIVTIKHQDGYVDPVTMSGHFLIPVKKDDAHLPYVAIVNTTKSFLYREDIVRILPEGYSELRNRIEANKNSVAVATIQLRDGGRVVFYLQNFDTTGTVGEFVKAFEKKNPESKFSNQSDS